MLTTHLDKEHVHCLELLPCLLFESVFVVVAQAIRRLIAIASRHLFAEIPELFGK
jgi:hypothetical protein